MVQKNPRNSKKDSRTRLKKITVILSQKIMEYDSKLRQHPPELISISDSEKDRQEVNEFYSNISTESSKHQLLDSQFYTQLLIMQQERDKSILQEGTTRRERISFLAQYMHRVSTPTLFLNHTRVIQLSDNIWDVAKLKQLLQNKTKNIVLENNEMNETDLIGQELTENQLQKLKQGLLDKLQQSHWTLEELENSLTHWEADIFSQLTRDRELLLEIEDGNVIKIIQNTKIADLNYSYQIQAFILEPKQ